MTKLSEIKSRVEALVQDAILEDINFAAIFSGRKDKAEWRDAVSNCEIIFEGSDNQRVRYPSYRDIDFSGPEIDHMEWRHQVNRFFWLSPLAGLYQETGEEKWAQMARDSIEKWMSVRKYDGTETNDKLFPIGDCTLSAAGRLGGRLYEGWWGCAVCFDGSEAFSEEFVERMLQSTYDQLEFLYQNNTLLDNWRVAELDTLLLCSLVLPGAEKYLEYSVMCMNECFRNQVESDGSHNEHVPGYHAWMMNVFTYWGLIGHHRPELGICFDAQKLLNMLIYEISTKAPDGRVIGIGDGNSWALENPPADLKALWHRYDVLAHFLGMPEGNQEPESAFPDAGQYFMRDGMTEFILDATNYSDGHMHNARGAILCFHQDRMQLCDPGCFDYEHTNPWTYLGKCTQMHNTVTINQWMQNEFVDAVVKDFRDCKDYAFFRCIFSGGWMNKRSLWGSLSVRNARSVVGSHTRSFFWKKGKFAVVFDSLSVFDTSYEYAAHWQFQKEEVVFEPEQNRMYTKDKRWNVGIACVLSELPVTAVHYEGNDEKKLGYVAVPGTNLGGTGAPAPMLSVEGNVSGKMRTRFVHVIVPFEGEVMPQVSASWEKDNDAMQLVITVGEDTLYIGANLRFIDGTSGPSVVGFKNKVKSDRHFAVESEDWKIEI